MTETADVMIRLDRVSKRYPGQSADAVRELSMDIGTGETVVLLGPSGCGKTTTLRLINRLIEPSGGRITVDGQDIGRVDPDKLRRRIGYVIQQIGLFPHLTIAQNIGVVPKLLGWPKARIAERVDELLGLVGLAADGFRNRYPRQLSGGQQQRVGVARALAADPPVMLMDEPFGATDPITREHLQNEFLRLQRELRKTVIFVTHDFEEAIRLGDRIAVLRDGSHVAQYDRPARILGAPADDYVAGFIGVAGTLKRLALITVEEAFPTGDGPPVPQGLPEVEATATLRDALDAMVANDTEEIAAVGGETRRRLTYHDVCQAIHRDGQEVEPSGA